VAKPKYLTDPKTFNTEWKRLVQLRDETSKRLNEVNSLIQTLEESSTLPDEVEDNLADLKNEAANLQSLLTSSQTYATSIESYYATWSETKGKIDAQLEEAQEQNKTLKVYTKQTTELKGKLTDELKRSKTLLDDARKTLDIVTDSALSSAFQKRSEKRKTSRRWWFVIVILAVGLFVAAVLLAVNKVAKDIADQNAVSVWVLKLVLVTPFVYILYFVTKQYSRERDLEEKYAFKALISQTIQNNTKLLKDEFINGKTVDRDIELKIIDFTVESLKSVYKEPFSEASLETKIKLNPFKTTVEAEAKQTEK
jgi:hypothetical protein